MAATSEIADFTRNLGHYLRPAEVALVENAYEFSEEAHRGQFRKTGDPYITHPLAVASILSEIRLDAQGLCAALLHDVMEDTAVTRAEIELRFGKSVAALVDGVSKLDQIEFQTREEAQAENFRKMLLAMAKDIRVILIKLADRLHNMRTLDVMEPDQRQRIAQETIDIFGPLANRLGLNAWYQELQDLAFRQLRPMRYRVLAKAIKSARGNRREVVGKMLEAIQSRLKASGIEALVTGREKTVFSVHKKMVEKDLSFSQVFDIYGFRILVNEVTSCYAALGVLHGLYKPLPGKFKDYIAIPKANGYQSLHTTLFGPYGTPVEIQVRTQEMHRVAEAGVAAHWLYKDLPGEKDLAEAQQQTHHWLESLLEIQRESGDSSEFLEHVKGDLFPDEIYVFTPKGRIMALPRGATPVDFAYAVHTDIGHHCVAAKVNRDLAPLRTALRNGDQVEIVTSPSAKPNASWLSFVATGKARSRIRHYLKSLHQRESAQLGERMLQQALATLGEPEFPAAGAAWDRLTRTYGVRTRQEVLADVGTGRRHAFVVAQALLATGERTTGSGTATSRPPISLDGVERVAIQYAKCCRPVPGDPIVGEFRAGQGMIVHLTECPVLQKRGPESGQLLDVDWAKDVQGEFDAGIRLSVADQRGVLAKVAAAISDAEANIENVSMDRPEGETVVNMFFAIQVNDRQHLARVMRALRQIPEVQKIQRART